MNEKILHEIDDVHEKVYQAANEYLRIWRTHILFSWQWWLILFLTISPWILWIVFRKKESSDRLLYAGSFVLIVSAWLDFIGIQYRLWQYNIHPVPALPAFITFDFCILPVTVMFFLQYKPKFSPSIKAILFAVIFGFVSEPILKWINVYNPLRWSYFYSFVIYVAIYLIAHWISRRENFARIE